MKTQGEIEAAICEGVSRFGQDYMGRGPKNIYAHLLGDLLVVRLQGVLTAAEQHLVKSLSADKGRDLLKQVRCDSPTATIIRRRAGNTIGLLRFLFIWYHYYLYYCEEPREPDGSSFVNR